METSHTSQPSIWTHPAQCSEGIRRGGRNTRPVDVTPQTLWRRYVDVSGRHRVSCLEARQLDQVVSVTIDAFCSPAAVMRQGPPRIPLRFIIWGR